MKHFKILFFLLLLTGCKDGLTLDAPPSVTTLIGKSVTQSPVLSAKMSGNMACIRGFIISKSANCTIDFAVSSPDQAEIIWCESGSGTYTCKPSLEGNQQYWICAFAYYPGQAHNVGYGNILSYILP